MGNRRVLVVEDNLLNREILAEILSERYTVLEAGNGKEALEILEKQQGDIMLILLDVMMPVMDGYTFLEEIKKIPEFALIPVIVMTQGDSEEDELKALALGAADFVPKPYRPQIILHRVAGLIKLRETAAMANQFKYDRLTGLYSREFFCQQARELLAQHPEKEYDIIGCNIENFKLYNDAFGVRTGDRLLCEIAGYFKERSRDGELFCRFRADRFVWMEERCPEYQDDMFFTLSQQISELTNAKNLSLKWGVYRIVDRSVPVERMCDRVLLAADSIKGQYLKHLAVYDETMRKRLLREQEIMDDMETALEEQQFEVHFQPKFSLIDGKLSGSEALVRWCHPQKGMISPGEFIPLFEKNGFITRMDHFVWEQACIFLSDWKKKGYPRLPVSVNVSRADFYQTDLADTLTKLTQKYHIAPSELHLEVTESAYTENPAQILNTIRKLRKLGFLIELDDFGSGYSSLNMLNQMELDIVKLDMAFIRSEMEKPADQGILRFVVDLAHWKKLRVVAEGVETKEQAIRIKGMGCEYAQGYYFSKPLPAAAFEEMLKKQSEEEKKAP